MESNSITLDPNLKDALGLPVLRVTYKSHPDDLKNLAFFRDRALDLLEAAGAKKKWGFPVEDTRRTLPRASHLMGACRMGNDPKSSVVDKYHRTHDVANLFIVDGSSVVTSGRTQPTCTIQALAYRASRPDQCMAKSGSIPMAL